MFQRLGVCVFGSPAFGLRACLRLFFDIPNIQSLRKDLIDKRFRIACRDECPRVPRGYFSFRRSP